MPGAYINFGGNPARAFCSNRIHQRSAVVSRWLAFGAGAMKSITGNYSRRVRLAPSQAQRQEPAIGLPLDCAAAICAASRNALLNQPLRFRLYALRDLHCQVANLARNALSELRQIRIDDDFVFQTSDSVELLAQPPFIEIV